MKHPCFDAGNIESKDKSIFLSLKNNINRGQIQSLTYFCSLVSKKGRKISFVSHLRILVLLIWKNKPHSVGYIQAMRKLPPWSDLPDRKFQKELKMIKGMDVKDKLLEIAFNDDEQSWLLECQSKNMAKKWQNLIMNHMKLQQKRQTERKNVEVIQASSEDSQISFEIKEKTEKGTPPKQIVQGYSITQPLNLNHSFDTANRRQECVQESSIASQNYVQLSERYSKHKEQWLKKETEYKSSISMLRQQNKQLKLEIQKLNNLNKEIKQQTARMRISKSVLCLLKEEYQQKHLQYTQSFKRKNFEIKQLLQKCAELIIVNKRLEKDVQNYKKKQKRIKQKHEQSNIEYDFQLSSSSNENNKQSIENQQILSYKTELQRRNTQVLMKVNQEHKREPNQFTLIRQNTIY